MLCGLGNALVDALVRIPDDAVLSDLGLDRGTMHLVDDGRWQQIYGRVGHLGAEIHPGGSCANTIVTAGLLGAQADLCANVGTDSFGDLYVKGVADAIGDHHVHQLPGVPTGKCLSLVSIIDAERTMVTDLGGAMQLPAAALFRDTIAGADLFHCTAYLFTGGPIGAVADTALAIAREHGTKISFDVADPWVIDAFRDRLRPVVEELADIVFMNESEARLWGQSDDAVAAARALSARVPIVVLKLGSRGSMVLWHGREHVVEVTPVKAVDTTGAGDAYAGGFLYGLDRGFEPPVAAAIAGRIAAATVSRVGAVVRDRAEAQALVADLIGD